MFGVAAVEAVGDARCVEQIQRDPPDVGAPDGDADVLAGEIEVHRQAGTGERHAGWLELGEPLLLPTVGVEVLAEVALRVQQSDSNERDTEVRRCLEVIAGEDPQASAVLGHRFDDAELG